MFGWKRDSPARLNVHNAMMVDAQRKLIDQLSAQLLEASEALDCSTARNRELGAELREMTTLARRQSQLILKLGGTPIQH